MKRIKIIYWIVTGLLCAAMTFSSIPNIMVTPESVEVFKHLGYPTYLIPFLGVAKLLAVVAILVPGFPRLKEWSYAGLLFDLTGAIYGCMAIGDPFAQWSPLLIGPALILASYFLYHKKRTLHMAA